MYILVCSNRDQGPAWRRLCFDGHRDFAVRALAIEASGFDVVVAQGYEAGGHRGIFDPEVAPAIGTLALTRQLTFRLRMPVVAAGGIMDGQGIATVLRLGAAGAQLGTAFILCPESSATDSHRQLLRQPEGLSTGITAAISGRPARGLVNRYFHDIGTAGHPPVPDYPLSYDAVIALHTAAVARGAIGLCGQPGWPRFCIGTRDAGQAYGRNLSGRNGRSLAVNG